MINTHTRLLRKWQASRVSVSFYDTAAEAAKLRFINRTGWAGMEILERGGADLYCKRKEAREGDAGKRMANPSRNVMREEKTQTGEEERFGLAGGGL